jgi:hypothetical protein
MILTCESCKIQFEISRKEYNSRTKRNKLGLFCSPKCVHNWQSQFYKKQGCTEPSKKAIIRQDGLRKCSMCKEFLPPDQFGSHKKDLSHCKPCFSAYVCRRYNAKKVAVSKYLGDKCNRCGFSFPYQVYNLHHKDPSTKSFDWTKLRLQSTATVVAELQKCELLCANCHLIEHAGSPNWTDIEEMAEHFLSKYKAFNRLKGEA